MGFAYRSGDVAYYQGARPNLSGMSNVFVNTARCNQGGYELTTYGATQVDWAISQLGFSSYYIFNGNVDAYSAGVAFGQNGIPRFMVGKSGILIDCEDEGATGTHAWGPDQAIAFANGVRSVRPDIPYSSFIVYMNYTVNRRFNWQSCVNLGMGLCYARPGGPDDYQWWPANYSRYIKQDGTVNGIDADWHNASWASIIGTPAPQPPGDDMASQLYLYTPTNDLIWADHLNMTLRKIDQNTVERLQMEALLGAGKIYYIQVGEPSWTQMFGSFEYVTEPNISGEVKLTTDQVTTLGNTIASQITPGASVDDIKSAVTAALSALTLKAA